MLKDPTNPAAGTIVFDQFVDRSTTRTTNTDSKDYAFYLQDAWRPMDRLTITPGVRVDVIRRFDNLFQLPAQHTTEVGPRIGASFLLTSDARNIVPWGLEETRCMRTPR